MTIIKSHLLPCILNIIPRKKIVDFTGDNLNYVDKLTGELISCTIFLAVQTYRGFSYLMALSDLKQQEGGRKTKELAREKAVSETAICNWKSRYVGMGSSNVSKLRETIKKWIMPIHNWGLILNQFLNIFEKMFNLNKIKPQYFLIT